MPHELDSYDDVDFNQEEESYDFRLGNLAGSLIIYLRACKTAKAAEQSYDSAIDAQFDAYEAYLDATEALTEQESE